MYETDDCIVTHLCLCFTVSVWDRGWHTDSESCTHTLTAEQQGHQRGRRERGLCEALLWIWFLTASQWLLIFNGSLTCSSGDALSFSDCFLEHSVGSTLYENVQSRWYVGPLFCSVHEFQSFLSKC